MGGKDKHKINWSTKVSDLDLGLGINALSSFHIRHLFKNVPEAQFNSERVITECLTYLSFSHYPLFSSPCCFIVTFQV